MRRVIFYITIVLLLLHFNAASQADIVHDIENRFAQHPSKAWQEKIYVHSDRDYYLAGELIWFKLYEVDAASNKPIDINKVAYVEIISNDNKQVLQSKIEMNQGTGNGSFRIPLSIQSGNYILRAYTKWMKNFSADFYFEKIITIVNAHKRPDWPAHDVVDSVTIQFFPEGGNLVIGLESTVAFQAVSRNGKGVECSGAIINQENDTVARFNTHRFGMGQFQFTPQPDQQYKAVTSINGATTITTLPSAYKEGYTMHLENDGNGQVRITVSNNRSNSNEEVYLLAHTGQQVKLGVKKALQNGKAEFTFDKDQLAGGISQLTVFNDRKQPVCERLYFKRPESNLDIDIKSQQTEYNRRQKATLEITTRDKNTPQPANLSLSVYLLDSLPAIKGTDIASYFYLTSELRGNVESADYYFSANTPEVEEATENLLLTHGWRKFEWETVSRDSTPAFNFVPEYEGHVIEAKITNRGNGEAAQGVEAYLSVPGRRFEFKSAISDKNGNLRFNVDNIYGSNEIVIHTSDQSNSYQVEIIDPFTNQATGLNIPVFELSEKWKNQLLSRSIYAQAQNAYKGDSTETFVPREITDTTAFYGAPDSKYYLDDYTRFVTMEEVMREYVGEVRVRKVNGNFKYIVKNEAAQEFFEVDPLVLLDGVPVFNVNKIMEFDPLKIKALEVVTQKHYFGSLTANGIVSYNTYSGDLGGFELDPNAVIIQHQGLQLQRRFYSPAYESSEQINSRAPDFRTLLFWEPDIQTSETGKEELNFYTSDVPGNYLVVIQGISSDGLVGSAVFGFKVKDK